MKQSEYDKLREKYEKMTREQLVPLVIKKYKGRVTRWACSQVRKNILVDALVDGFFFHKQ